MEDRITPGLYLEMSSQAPERYATERVPELLELAAVSRATWWENVRPGRTDLPRKLPEFDLLGVYEVDDGFTPPEPPAGITGHHFRRYPRPGQGRLTGRPTIGLSLVLISPRHPEGAQALRDWGDFVHLRHIAEVGVPGYTMITPYENVDRRRPALPALLRDGHRRSRGQLPGDDPPRDGAHRRDGHPGLASLGPAPGAPDHVREHLPPARIQRLARSS